MKFKVVVLLLIGAIAHSDDKLSGWYYKPHGIADEIISYYNAGTTDKMWNDDYALIAWERIRMMEAGETGKMHIERNPYIMYEVICQQAQWVAMVLDYDYQRAKERGFNSREKVHLAIDNDQLRGVCSEYAILFQLRAQQVWGVKKVDIIISTDGTHVWNDVTLMSGHHVFVDVTWYDTSKGDAAEGRILSVPDPRRVYKYVTFHEERLHGGKLKRGSIWEPPARDIKYIMQQGPNSRHDQYIVRTHQVDLR